VWSCAWTDLHHTRPSYPLLPERSAGRAGNKIPENKGRVSLFSGIGTDMEQCLQAVLALLVRAKYPGPGDDKAALLADVNVELEVLRFQVRLANDLVALPLNGHGHAVKLAKVLADLPFFQAEVAGRPFRGQGGLGAGGGGVAAADITEAISWSSWLWQHRQEFRRVLSRVGDEGDFAQATLANPDGALRRVGNTPAFRPGSPCHDR